MRYHEITEAQERTLTLWHGGRDLESDYLEIISHKKGNWEYGPGLYLTTSYSTAAKYAKGGGKLYRVAIRQGVNISDVDLDMADVTEFVKRYGIASKRREFLDFCQQRMARSGITRLPAESFVTLLINLEAIQNTKTADLRHFLIAHGVDYTFVQNYGGSGETVVVVHNPRIIKKVEVVKPADVTSGFDVDPSFG